ncbi:MULTISPECIES: hypothetical protein [Empedobacter]|uniref:PEP-CTERM sorting domain-containing protein n=1 Tax=Empedobacter falsenii TaxID=343874 RepID=A0A7H9DVV5_9FLAO|nr:MULTISPECIES: hypothetical protein [Empedobacter]MDM1139212.1 hypothetical protein [Empedobacter sp. R132-2]QLL58816.1 hypothetical protein FH779_12245 [Empedobacter falsenii]
MKNIKQIILVAGVLHCSIGLSAQENKISFFESTNQNESSARPGTGGGGTDVEDADPAPIDDYLPLLVIGAGLVALRFRKQLLKN